MAFTYHINQIQQKTASEINERHLIDDMYHRPIAAAARKLVAEGNGQLRYGGQYQSGNTLWLGENGFSTIVRLSDE